RETESKRTSIAPHLALVGVQIFFGSLPVIVKVVLNALPAASLVGFRVGATAVLLAVVQACRGRFWLKRKEDYLKLAVLSFFGVVLNQLLFITGLSLTTASNTSLLAVTIPIFTLAVSSIIGAERLRPRKILGLLLAAVGVILLIDPRKASFASQNTIGDLMIVGNSLAYGVYVATSKDTITRNGAFRSMMWVFIFASVICVPYGSASLRTVDVPSVSTSIWLLVAYIAVGATAAPYLLNAWALARVNPSIVAIYIYLQPLIGFMMAVVFLGEPIGAMFAAAAALIFAGLFLVTFRRQTFETKEAVERI
ncbi:MAG TPA: DMT family transporter, partial [Pyrinomonadaceae bacterium]